MGAFPEVRWASVRERGRLLAGLGPLLLAGLVAVFAVLALLPTASAFAVGALVGRLVRLVGQGSDTALGPALPAAAAVAALVLIGHLAEQADDVLRFAAARRIDGRVRRLARQAALAAPGVAELEDARVQNDLAAAVDGWMGQTPGNGAVGQLWLVFRFAGAFAAAAVLARYSWPLALALLVGMIVLREMLRRQWLGLMGAAVAERENMRRTDYWADLASGPEAAKELRIFGFGRWAVDRHQEQGLATFHTIQGQLRKVMRRQPVVFALTTAACLASLLFPAVQAYRGGVDAGQLATYLRASVGVLALGAMGSEAYAIHYSRPSLDALQRLRDRPVARGADRSRPLARTGGPPAILFEDVSFGYPGSDRPVLDGLDLQVCSGEVLAVVGANGAGKTTLIKLLAGLYQPDRGRILADGVDLAAVDLDAWRSRLAVVFQDFIHYELSARDNVALGAVEGPAGALVAAVERAGATPLLDGLPSGWDTILSRGYPGGTDLSGGEWQRVALARALFAAQAGSSVLVLDEPTAHLDAHAELAVFDSLVAAVTGITVLLISHRFSTVRRADRIVVLEAGRILETGSHDALMDQRGRYATMFTLQAERFR